MSHHFLTPPACRSSRPSRPKPRSRRVVRPETGHQSRQVNNSMLLIHFCASVLCLSLPVPAQTQPGTLKASLQRTLQAHSAPPRQLAFSPDSRILATSGVDSVVKLWSVSDGKLMRALGHPGGVTSIAFSRDGQWLVSGSYDSIVRVWRIADGSLVRTLKGHAGAVWSVDVRADGERIASSGEDNTVRLWRLSDGAALGALRGHTLNVWHVAFSPDGKRLASGSFDKTVRIWRADTGTLERILSGHDEAVVGIAFSPGGAMLASGGDDNTVKIWRVSDGRSLKTIRVGNHVYSVAFSPDGRSLASGGREKSALGTLWKQIVGNRPGLRGANGKSVRLWRIRDGVLQHSLAGYLGDVWSVAFSPDGALLATTSEDGTVKLWRLVSS